MARPSVPLLLGAFDTDVHAHALTASSCILSKRSLGGPTRADGAAVLGAMRQIFACPASATAVAVAVAAAVAIAVAVPVGVWETLPLYTAAEAQHHAPERRHRSRVMPALIEEQMVRTARPLNTAESSPRPPGTRRAVREARCDTSDESDTRSDTLVRSCGVSETSKKISSSSLASCEEASDGQAYRPPEGVAASSSIAPLTASTKDIKSKPSIGEPKPNGESLAEGSASGRDECIRLSEGSGAGRPTGGALEPSTGAAAAACGVVARGAVGSTEGGAEGAAGAASTGTAGTAAAGCSDASGTGVRDGTAADCACSAACETAGVLTSSSTPRADAFSLCSLIQRFLTDESERPGKEAAI